MIVDLDQAHRELRYGISTDGFGGWRRGDFQWWFDGKEMGKERDAISPILETFLKWQFPKLEMLLKMAYIYVYFWIKIGMK